MRLPRRILLVPAWAVVTFLSLYVAFDVLLFLTLWRPGTEAFSRTVDLVLRFNFSGAPLIVGACAVYGIYRVLAFHPLFRGDYRNWLNSTPWKHPHKLPLGPVHLVWQDFVLLLIAWLSMFRYGSIESIESRQQLLLVPLFPVLLFLLVYLLFLSLTFRPARAPGFAYLLAFGYGLLVLLKMELLPTLSVVATMYAVAYFGVRKSLARFRQWDLTWYEENGFFGASKAEERRKSRHSQLGWQFSTIGPQKGELGVTYWDSVCLSVLFGWWVYVVSVVSDADAERMRLFSLYVCLGSAVVRAAAYCLPFRPPISFLGRLRTRQWFIPGYDHVFLAPLATVLAWFPTVSALKWLNAPEQVTCAIACTVTLLVALNMGPTYEKWRLTGHHSIVPPPLQANSLPAKQA